MYLHVVSERDKSVIWEVSVTFRLLKVITELWPCSKRNKVKKRGEEGPCTIWVIIGER